MGTPSLARRARSLAAVAVALLAARCTGATAPVTPDDAARATPCTAGMTVACPCPDGAPGIQTCDPGTGVFSACACPPADGGLDAGVDGSSSDVSDATAVSDTAPADGSVPLDGSPPPDVVAPDVVAPDVVAPDVVAPDVVAPDVVAPDASPDALPPADRASTDVPDATPDGPAGTPQTLVYAITELTIDRGPGGSSPNPMTYAQGVAGFNLDGRFSGAAGASPADCAHGDFFSALDPDQNMGACAAGSARGGASCVGGVDNQLPELASVFGGFGTDLPTTLADDVRAGRTAVILRVTGVDGAPGPSLDDPSVRVLVYPVAHPTFASCSAVGAPGSTYAVDDASLTTPGDLESARLAFTGRIARGRIIVDPPATAAGAVFPLTVSSPGPFTFPLQAAQVRFSVTPDRASDGNLGGYAPLAALVTALRPALPAGISESVVTTVLSSLIDVQLPAGAPAGCSPPDGGIAMGLGFTATRAALAPTTVRAAAPGTCGGPAGPAPGGCYVEAAAGPVCPAAAVAQADATRPSYRVTHLRVTAPAALTSAILLGTLNDALHRGNFLWGLSLDVPGGALRSGALNPARSTRGATGQGLFDGAFRYYAGDAPGGAATRYDSASTTLTGTTASASSGVIASLRLPIFDGSGGLLSELPLSDVRFAAVRPSAGTRCVGLGLPTAGGFNECTGAWQTADGTSPNGLVEGVLTVAGARSVQITALATSLCTILAGSDCDAVPQAMWMRPPDATAGGAPGWRFSAEFAAVSARVP